MQEDADASKLPKGYKPLDTPPDGCSPTNWERILRRDAYKEEERRFIDETDPRWAKDKSNRARVRAMQKH